MKYEPLIKLAIIAVLCVNARAMVMRNKALINKMVSHFQKDNYVSLENSNSKRQKDPDDSNQQKPEKVLSLMQNVLCRNFPAIPCKIIIADEKLKNLIEKSIQQIKHKSQSIEKTTVPPGYLTLFPIINSEELSSFLQVRDHNSYYKGTNSDWGTKRKQKKSAPHHWSQEKTQKKTKQSKKETKRTAVFNGRKKIRKFYPHKIKYKDKSNKNSRKDFGDYSEEKLSMSVELPDMTLTKHHQHLSYKVEPADPPVWRIDYMKHGEPSLNMLGYEDDRLKGKIIKTGPSVIVDENVLEQGARKDVLHPDVYIKKNFIRKTPIEANSENLD
jgi:hypothetical protein